MEFARRKPIGSLVAASRRSSIGKSDRTAPLTPGPEKRKRTARRHVRPRGRRSFVRQSRSQSCASKSCEFGRFPTTRLFRS
jgi:hypothetical protein